MNITAPFANAQAAQCVVMVPPINFGYNEQTGRDNAFQKPLTISKERISKRALVEFEKMIGKIRQAGAYVIKLNPPANGLLTPDAVFPNNWFMTNNHGDLFIFPMLTENRQREIQFDALSVVLSHAQKSIRQVSTIGNGIDKNRVLEGTGAMVLDRANSRIYAALSERCNPDMLQDFANIAGFSEVITFDTLGMDGKPIYHTNVVMSIGECIAVICSECIPDSEQREEVLAKLSEHHTVIDINKEQMNKFCGNTLQLKNLRGERLWVMSQTAWDNFKPQQRQLFQSDGIPLVCEIPTIESVGGGSCRCMLAEVFLPGKAL